MLTLYYFENFFKQVKIIKSIKKIRFFQSNFWDAIYFVRF